MYLSSSDGKQAFAHYLRFCFFYVSIFYNICDVFNCVVNSGPRLSIHLLTVMGVDHRLRGFIFLITHLLLVHSFSETLVRSCCLN